MLKPEWISIPTDTYADYVIKAEEELIKLYPVNYFLSEACQKKDYKERIKLIDKLEKKKQISEFTAMYAKDYLECERVWDKLMELRKEYSLPKRVCKYVYDEIRENKASTHIDFLKNSGLPYFEFYPRTGREELETIENFDRLGAAILRVLMNDKIL